ncbi:hypothetical protein [Nocardia sp. NPDC051570]|uniref:hypothetical protein n=1 Tax=Nocardia sp. NPDC051570 TaxID=3364324 RepID=UPI00379B5295
MTVRRLIIGSGVAIGVMATALGAGSASAADFRLDPAKGFAGVYLDHADTAMLANTPVPDWLNRIATPDNSFFNLSDDSRLPLVQEPDGSFWSPATAADVWREAARQPNGRLSVFWLDPARYDGYSFEVRQEVPRPASRGR